MRRAKCNGVGRRDLLIGGAASVLAGAGLGRTVRAAAEPLHFVTWSAAVDQVKSHLDAFEKKTGIKVDYSNTPWANYRDTHVTKFVAAAPIDVLWVSDSWLPEWADARLARAGRSVQGIDAIQQRRHRFLQQFDDVQGPAIRHHLLQRQHGLLLQRGDATEGRHLGAAAELG